MDDRFTATRTKSRRLSGRWQDKSVCRGGQSSRQQMTPKAMLPQSTTRAPGASRSKTASRTGPPTLSKETSTPGEGEN